MSLSENSLEDRQKTADLDESVQMTLALNKASEFNVNEDIGSPFPLEACTESHESSLCSHSSSSSSSMGTNMLVPAKMVLFRGHYVAAFVIEGKDMICLPQVYELFLKNMVGGLHTVYTKLKRLDISPIVCNIEQVRTLRSLGAIQPGVNRCKLLEKTDFEKLYEDCTNTGTRPGRPSKRATFSEWSENNSTKKDKSSSASSDSPVDIINTLGGESNSGQVFNQMLPQLTPQQILMHHFVTLTQKSSSEPSYDRNEEEERSQRNVNDGTPLNLSKNGTSSENDSDSLESMRKEDSSPNNSLSDRGGSNSNSLSMSMEGGSSSGKNEEGTMMNKVMSLIEIASQQFKHEREELWKERNEIQVLRESFHKIVQEERDLRKKLESQSRKCAAYEKRYKFVNRQLLLVNAELRRYKESDRTNHCDDGKDNL